MTWIAYYSSPTVNGFVSTDSSNLISVFRASATEWEEREDAVAFIMMKFPMDRTYPEIVPSMEDLSKTKATVYIEKIVTDSKPRGQQHAIG